MVIIYLGERLSWKKFSYLKDIHEDFGSPFSKGIKANLRHLKN